jgi:hypothetical protein
MADDVDAVFNGMTAEMEFLELIRQGRGEYNAGVAVGWTVQEVTRKLKDREFNALIGTMKTSLLESCEEKLVEMALNGNLKAIEMILYNRGADRGWKPPAQRVQVDRTDVIKLEMVASVTEAVRTAVTRTPIAELQPGGSVEGIVDAEVVDGDPG